MKILLIITMLLGTICSTSSASLSDGCTHWVMETGVSCVMPDSQDGKLWKRNCDNSPYQCRTPKIPKNRKPCPAETLCVWPKADPNYLGDSCSEWVHRNSVSCSNGSDSWYRVCTINYIDTLTCTNDNPNN